MSLCSVEFKASIKELLACLDCATDPVDGLDGLTEAVDGEGAGVVQPGGGASASTDELAISDVPPAAAEEPGFGA